MFTPPPPSINNPLASLPRFAMQYNLCKERKYNEMGQWQSIL